MKLKFLIAIPIIMGGVACAQANELPPGALYREKVQPILTHYCYDCHADGADKGGISLDKFASDAALVTNKDLWLAVLKNVRAGLMPPAKRKERPSEAEVAQLAGWIKYQAFEIDPHHPEPGNATIRRLNRVEYRNTIRDLLGVDFDTRQEFPPDDTGNGFDNMADVLTLSPMLLEKYSDAAVTIIGRAVPAAPRVIAEKTIRGSGFVRKPGNSSESDNSGPIYLSYYQPSTVTHTFRAEHPGHYALALDLTASESFVDGQFDYNQCRLSFKADGIELLHESFVRQGNMPFHYDLSCDWQPGAHELSIEITPTSPDQKQVRSLSLRIDRVTVSGPSEKEYWVEPKRYREFFPKDVPAGHAERIAYARELLGAFATRAFRRPCEDDTPERLAALAERIYDEPGRTFEEGVAQAMAAVLVSPRFLFRGEPQEAPAARGSRPLADEYALASRLSYFLWSSMPDAELIRLAGRHELRANLTAQVRRMMADPRSEALERNFFAQWLQTRDIETVPIEARAVLARDSKPDPEEARRRLRFKALTSRADESLSAADREELTTLRAAFGNAVKNNPTDLGWELRQAMRREAELYFEGIVREDRNVIELVNSDYDFLNEKLARHYGLTNLGVTGNSLRRVTLPEGSVRGGVLTMGSVLAATSNPTRTSPVKRGLFVLQNILGTPPPPPPPNIPPLEDAKKDGADHAPTSREALAIHRSQPTCNSCHGRMDPLGLAFENFNAMGMWREKEFGENIEAGGSLATGESFTNVVELKHILATNHRLDFYRTMTEKMLIYALGRGLEYYDVETVDQIVARLERDDGRFSSLLMGVIESAPFQLRREPAAFADAGSSPKPK